MLELHDLGNSFLFQLKNGHFIVHDGGEFDDILPIIAPLIRSCIRVTDWAVASLIRMVRVSGSGMIADVGERIDRTFIGVRPAMWIE